MAIKLLTLNMLLEEQIAKFFGSVSKLVNDDHVARLFWSSMKDEEIRHFEHLESELRNLQSNPNFYKINPIDTSSIEKFLVLIESISHEVQDPFINKIKLYESARDLMQCLLQIHLDLADQLTDKNLKHLFFLLGRQDQFALSDIDKHLEKMTKTVKKAA